MSEQDSDFVTFLAGFIVGGLVGTAVALLLAPQSGEETRAVIREKGIEIKDRTIATAEETRARAEKALEEARIRADEALEDVRARAEEVTRLTRERAIELQQRGQVVLEEQKSRFDSVVETGKKAVERVKGETSDEPSTPPAGEA
jgi:gas vesicle protein